MLKYAMTGKINRFTTMGLFLTMVLSALLLLSACNETTAATMRPSTTQSNPQLQLLGRVNSLESEVSRLQNTVDVQENELSRLRERLSGIYDDLDRRMRSIEMSSVSMNAPVAPASGMMTDNEIPSIPKQEGMASRAISPADATVSNQAGISAPAAAVLPAAASTINGQEGTSQLEQASYDRAFDLLKQSRYDEAIAAFKEFQTRFPASALADGAQYWIAEARYVNRAYDAALHEYSTLIQRYPKSKRLPDAMLKVGYIHFDNEQWEQARRALNAVVIRYPGSRVAVSAKMRLDQMTKTGH
ncbi:MAG: tol-pal system protein YbgF [Pseudomonadota bacterium]|nr:tol-pal system protein YbgF [Pseudomonadota bacterium]